MLKIKSVSSSLTVNFKLAIPLFDWNVIPTRFFEMIHSALSPDFAINSRDFTHTPGNSLADVVSKYNIFGGPSFVALSAENLSFDFASLLPSDCQLVLQIIENVESGFFKCFPNCQLSTVRITSFEHAEIVSDTVANDYLIQFAIQSVEKVCSQTGADHIPMGRFMIRDTEWFAICSVEKSEVVENGILLGFDLQLLNVNATDNFQEKMNRVNRCILTCGSALDLEWENVS